MTWKEHFSLSIISQCIVPVPNPKNITKFNQMGGEKIYYLTWWCEVHNCMDAAEPTPAMPPFSLMHQVKPVSTCVFLGNGLGVSDHKSVPHHPMNHWIVWCINQWQVASGSTRLFIWAESFPLFSYIWVQLIVVMLIWCWVNFISSCFLWFPSGCPLLYFFLPCNSRTNYSFQSIDPYDQLKNIKVVQVKEMQAYR